MVKKIISKKVTKQNSEVPAKEVESRDQDIDELARTPKSRRVCLFCQSKSVPSYTDIVTLRHYLTERAKIVPKLRSNLCSKHQRVVTKQIKYSRHLALLPFTPKV